MLVLHVGSNSRKRNLYYGRRIRSAQRDPLLPTSSQNNTRKSTTNDAEADPLHELLFYFPRTDQVRAYFVLPEKLFATLVASDLQEPARGWGGEINKTFPPQGKE